MDQNTQPTMKTPPAVDSLLHDILQGAPTTSSTPVNSFSSDPAFTPVAVAAQTAPSAFPETSFHSAPQQPFQAQAVPVMPTAPITSVVPLASVAPVTLAPAAPTVSNAGGQQFEVAQPPAHTPFPKTSIIAAVAVIAVVLTGVGAGVILSGENQDVRNQAYVAPSQRQAANNVVDTTAEVSGAGPTNIIVIPSGRNAFIGAQAAYPNAVSSTIEGEGVTGQLFIAENPEAQSKVYYAQISGLQADSTTSHAVAWLEYEDGSFSQIATVDQEATENGDQGFFVYEDLSSKTVKNLVLSYENPENVTDPNVDVSPTQKVVNVAL